MFLDRLKTGGADHMLDAAGVFHSSLFVHAQEHEPLGQGRMAFIYGFRDLSSGVGQGDKTIAVDDDKTVFPEIFHSYADAGLGKIQFKGDIDGTDVRFAPAEDQDRFQIIFSRFLYFQ